jgi:hypothetical protein
MNCASGLSLHDNYFLNVPMGGNVSPDPPLPGMAQVTQQEFEAISVAQLTELWSNYGDFVESTRLWFWGLWFRPAPWSVSTLNDGQSGLMGATSTTSNRT